MSRTVIVRVNCWLTLLLNSHTPSEVPFSWSPWVLFSGNARRSMRSMLAAIFASIKEFYWDYNFEDPVDRGSDLEDFAFYMLGAFVGFLVNLFLPGTLDPRVLCFCAPRYQRLDGTPEKQNYGLCLWRQPGG